MGNSQYSCLFAAHLSVYQQLFENLYDFSCWAHCLSLLKACQSEKHIGQHYTLPSAHIRTLFPHGLPRRFQQQVCAYVYDNPQIVLITHMTF